MAYSISILHRVRQRRGGIPEWAAHGLSYVGPAAGVVQGHGGYEGMVATDGGQVS